MVMLGHYLNRVTGNEYEIGAKQTRYYRRFCKHVLHRM